MKCRHWSQGWLFVALDEAHLVRNPDSAVAKAARQLQASHRLALTGTPIQNTVLELWSLFDFLMPGYLGERSIFRRHVASPVLAALDPQCDGHDAVKGLGQLEELHRQAGPPASS
ncbi:unnamed protein product [Discosporangium mesarthrocarpum]